MKSHEVLMNILNNIGTICAIFCAIADIVLVTIFVVGVNVERDTASIISFSVSNAVFGLLINVFLRYQGQKYAEIENGEIISKYYKKKAKETKYRSIKVWSAIQVIKDVIIKGVFLSASIFCTFYISIKGSGNIVLILIAIVSMLMFICFGLIGMNSAYNRFYNIDLPYMKLKIEEKGEEEKCNYTKMEKL